MQISAPSKRINKGGGLQCYFVVLKKKCMLYNSFNNSYYLGREEEEFGFCLQFHISHNLACISNFCEYSWGGGGRGADIFCLLAVLS